jgi:hypothetical protein
VELETGRYMKFISPWLWAPVITITGLCTLSGYLVNQNAVYARKNRALLLQNDSILSVNLDIANELNKLKKAPCTTAGEPNRVKPIKK